MRLVRLLPRFLLGIGLSAGLALVQGSTGIDAFYSIETSFACGDPCTTIDIGAFKNLEDSGTKKPGDEVTFTIGATSTGNGTAEDVVVKDDPPDDLIFLFDKDNDCRKEGSKIVCGDPVDLAPGQRVEYELTFRIDPDTDSCRLQNKMTAEAGNTSGIRTAQANVTVECRTIAIGAFKNLEDSGTKKPGDEVTFTIGATSTGNGTAEDVVVKDDPPDDLIFLFDKDNDCRKQGSKIVCGDPVDLAPGQRVEYELTFRIDPDTDSCRLQNKMTAEAGNTSGIRTAQANVTVECRTIAIGAFKNLEDSGTKKPGDEVTFTIGATSTGNGTAEDVVVKDDPPDDLIFLFDKDNDCRKQGSKIVCGDPVDLAPGQRVEYELTFRIDPDTDSCRLQNKMTAEAGNTSGIRTAQANVIVECTFPSIAATKRADTMQFVPGDEVTFWIGAVSNGTERAEDVVIKDQFPIDLEFLTGPGKSDGDCRLIKKPKSGKKGEIECKAVDLEPGEHKEYKVVFKIDPWTKNQKIINWSSAEASNISHIYTAHKTLIIDCDPHLTGLKESDKEGQVISFGDHITYTITVENTGHGAAFDVEITDPIPEGLQFVGATGDVTCSKKGNEIVCKKINILGDDSIQVHLEFEVTVQ